jgi:hypothetical protein
MRGSGPGAVGRRCVWLRVVLIVSACGGLGLAAPQLVGTAAARVGHWRVAVGSPSDGAVVLGSTVRVVVRVPAGVAFRARIGHRVVTSAFHRAAGGERVGRLGVRRGLRYGRNTMRFRTDDGKGARRYAEVSFFLARHVPGLLRSATARARRGHVRVTLRLSSSLLRSRVRLNRGAETPLGGGRARSIMLDGDNGLSHGHNVVSVIVLDRRRREYASRQLNVEVQHTLPIPAAGRSQRVTVGGFLRADASRSQAAFRGSRLRYTWRIVQAPKRAGARLHGVHSVRPWLRPSRPGRYVLQVTVTEVRRGANGQAALAAASTDTLPTSVAGYVPPIGLPIDTIARQGASVGMTWIGR